MVSLFRLKGRALQIGNFSLLLLTFLTAFTMIIAVNLLPAIYIKAVEPEVTARVSDYGGYIAVVVAVLIFLLVFCVFNSMRLGIKRFFFKKAQKKNPVAEDIFFYFKVRNFFKCFSYSFKITFIRLFLLSFCLLPCGICFLILQSFSQSGVSALVCTALFITALCLFINGIVFYYSFFSSYFLCDYYYIEGSFISFSHLIASSQKMMSGRKNILHRLKLSFSGWFILSLLIVPLPYVWSYYNQSLAVAAAEFMKGKGE